jgi:filamentous hemagglutinin family protein
MQTLMHLFSKIFAVSKYGGVVFLLLILHVSAQANPVVSNIVSGQVSIQQANQVTTIQQTTPKAIIEWNSFNISAGETTHFQQPSGGVALNRINPSQGVSQIYGRLTATGQIILVNPAGIFFGPGSYVNVGGLIASTANISNADFLNDYYHFATTADSTGAVVNQGTLIAAEHGLIALIGGAVSNNGEIVANVGHVVLASGDVFVMSFVGNELVEFKVEEGVHRRVKDNQGNEMADGVTNNGSIIANGGQVIISAKDAAGVLDHVINMSGYVEVKSVYKRNGSIVISGGRHRGVVRIASRINASGNKVGEKGGSITISGHHIILTSDANLDANGHSGGGTIKIGGKPNRVGALPAAHAIVMEEGATISANANVTGNGGNVVLWSEEYTHANGSISAKGGSNSGNGGLVETSSHQILVVGALSVDTSSAHGQSGEWLLDPANITIGLAANARVNASSPFTPTAANSFLNVNTLTNALALNNVTVYTSNDGFAGLGDINVTAPISWTSAFNLTLSAYHSINVSNATTITNTGGGNVSLIADNAGTGSGTVTFGVGSNVVLSGGTVEVFYNPTVFGVPDTIYVGGTASTDYQLINSLGAEDGSTPRSLAALSKTPSLWSQNFGLAKNIDASATSAWDSGQGFTPIGDGGTSYTGHFSGRQFMISNLYINRSTDLIALFGNITGTGTLSHLTLVNPNITGRYLVGGMVGSYSGTLLSDLHVTGGTITGDQNAAGNVFVGGIVGWNLYSTINNVSNSATISGGSLVGGIAGDNLGNLSNSINTGLILGANGAQAVGGIAGYANVGTISNALNTGDIYVIGDAFWIGGAVGYIDTDSTTLINIINTGKVTVTGMGNYVGGFGGAIYPTANLITINNTFTSGLVTVGDNSNTATVGGYIGANFVAGNYSNNKVAINLSGIEGINAVAGTDSINYYIADAVFVEPIVPVNPIVPNLPIPVLTTAELSLNISAIVNQPLFNNRDNNNDSPAVVINEIVVDNASSNGVLLNTDHLRASKECYISGNRQTGNCDLAVVRY